ncbi:putative AAA+ ATPase domain, ATPase, AAA-type, core, replication factor C [Helianthus annuus]|nr:putative AAA+ ATPase domain, ATPase, AAA-type, core, replication factor C [Helianthus annuus]
MAEVISLMDIDDDNTSLKPNNNKGKAVAAPPAHTKTTPWVEKFRPQSLADVAAHRDIIDTSMVYLVKVFILLNGLWFARVFSLGHFVEQLSFEIVEWVIGNICFLTGAFCRTLDRLASDGFFRLSFEIVEWVVGDLCFLIGAFRQTVDRLATDGNLCFLIAAFCQTVDRLATDGFLLVRVLILLNSLWVICVFSLGHFVKQLIGLLLMVLFVDRLTSENKMPHLLLYGPPGTGKTSTILAVARKLFGSQMHNMVLELNASDERGIDVVRQQIQDFASTQSFSFGAKASVKLVLLDEADAMTKDAQFALRRVIERYTKSTRFALICNNVNKIIPALQSRCTRFRFAPLDAVNVTERLKYVINAEGLDVTEDGLAALVRLSNGDMRKALNILQSTHMASQQITEEAVYLCTGNPLPKDIEQISYWLLNEPFSDSFRMLNKLLLFRSLSCKNAFVSRFVFRIKMPSDVRVHLINDLADIEYRLTFGCNDKLQLGSVISTFTRARSAIVAAAK